MRCDSMRRLHACTHARHGTEASPREFVVTARVSWACIDDWRYSCVVAFSLAFFFTAPTLAYRARAFVEMSRGMTPNMDLTGGILASSADPGQSRLVHRRSN